MSRRFSATRLRGGMIASGSRIDGQTVNARCREVQDEHGWDDPNNASFRGKYLVVTIEGRMELHDSIVKLRGKDPGMLWRKKATNYLRGKLEIARRAAPQEGILDAAEVGQDGELGGLIDTRKGPRRANPVTLRRFQARGRRLENLE